MIEIIQESKKVIIKTDTKVGWVTNFYRESASELDAKLLANQLQKALNQQIEAIRSNAYQQGWRDKASHKTKKKKFFSTDIKNLNGCY